MNLPFTERDFLDVFASYNLRFWPVALAFWVLSAGLVIGAVTRGAPHHRALSALLAAMWAWSALG